MPEELPDVKTKVSHEQMFEALSHAWKKIAQTEPTKQQLAILVAQWGGETGWGAAMHCYNIGNAKHRDGDGRDWTYFKCWELEKGEKVWYSPKHPACAFRAFRTLDEGALDYFDLIYNKYKNAWDAVLSGDPVTYSHELKKKGYYTATEESYANLMKGCFAVAMKAKWEAGGGGEKPPPVEPHPSLGPKDPFGAYLGADYAIAAYERAIGAHGYKIVAEDEKHWDVEKDGDLGPGNFEKLAPASGDLALIVTGDGPRNGRVVTVAAASAKNYDSGTLVVTGMTPTGIGMEKLTLESKPVKFDPSYTSWQDGETKPGAGKAWVVRVLRLSEATPDKLDGMSPDDLKKWHVKKDEIVLSPATEIKWEAKKKPNDPTTQADGAAAPPKDQPAASEPKGRSADEDPAAFKVPPPVIELPPPQQIDPHTVSFKVGNYPGRIAFTIRKPGEPLPVPPPPGKPADPVAQGKRDDFVRAAMNFLGAPYLARSSDPAKGVDGPGLVGLCCKRVGLLKKEDEIPDSDGLHAMFGSMGGKADEPPDEILPGDLAWFGRGDHDNIPQQHPMIYLGGGRVLGPIPDGGPQNGAVQVIAASAVPETFAGWTHLSDLGSDTGHTAHPGPPPGQGQPLSGAVLPASPAARYDLLKAMVAKKGGSWLDDKGKVNLVGIRAMHERRVIQPKDEDWNDSVFACFLDDDGHKCSLEMRASLDHASDADKAGKWQLVDGGYKFKLEKDGDKPVLRPDGNVKAWFDEHGQGALRPGDLLPPDFVPGQAPPATKEAPGKGGAAAGDKTDQAVEFTVKDDAGKPLAGWAFEIDGGHKGKLDDQGHGKVDKLVAGSHTLKVYQDKDAPKKAPPATPAPPVEPGDPGEGFASKLRAAPIDETLKLFKDEGEQPSSVKSW